MTKKAGVKPGLEVLRKRLKHNQLTIKTVYKTEYATLIKSFRSDVAKAKKAGLLKDVDARKALPTAQITKRLNEVRGVLEGSDHAQKIDKKLAQELKRQNFDVIGDRIILPKNSKITKSGELHVKKGAFISITKSFRAGPKLEDDIKQIMESLGPNQYVGIPLPDSNYSGLFGKNEAGRFIEKANEYLKGDLRHGALKYIYIQTVLNEIELDQWEENRRKEKLAKIATKKKERIATRKNAREFNKVKNQEKRKRKRVRKKK